MKESPDRMSLPVAAGCKRKAGRKKFRETRHPVYRGVRERNGGKWVCEVREPVQKNRIWLGTYRTPELAGRAHDVAALALRGDSAQLNFPDSAWLVPRAKSGSASDIRLAALQLATTKLVGGSSDYKAVDTQNEDPSSSSSSSSSSSAGVEKVLDSCMFWDEEAMFNMPGLIDRMAEAMILTPPGYKKSGVNWDDALSTSYVDFNLWEY